MDAIQPLLEQNRKWAQECEQQDPGCFARQSNAQAPKFLWIGCIDSRVPPEQLTGLGPGHMLVYRNIANQVSADDVSVMSAIQFAVDALKVSHIIVSGHSNCGGIAAALGGGTSDNLNSWLTPLQTLGEQLVDTLDRCASDREKIDHLCQINIKQQVLNVAGTEIVQQAWQRGQQLSVHGCLYDVATGALQTIGIPISSPEQAKAFTI